MPPPRATWSNLLVGVVCLAGLVVAAVLVLTFARVGALHGSTVRLYATTDQARGVFPGTDVWMEGQKIGRVVSVGFRPPSVDTTQRLLVELEVLAEDVPYVRRDSWTQIRAGGNLIGSPVVWVRAGSAAAARVHEGDTLPMHPQGDMEDVMSRVTVAGADFPRIMADVHTMVLAIDSARGTAGAVLSDGRGPKQIAVAKQRAFGLIARATRGGGTTGLVFRGGARDAMQRARLALAGTDSLRLLLASQNTSIGRFRRDSTLLTTVGDLRDEVSIVRALLDEPRGTAGRVLHDPALFDQLAAAQRDLGALMQDIKAHPFRYLSASF